ncbi:hypothetical protein KAU45_05500, partial [bacterium]|nr:hypothetical protein [bacterium]
MANARVQRIEIILHASARDDLLGSLANAGAVELESADPEELSRLGAPCRVRAEEASRSFTLLRGALDYLDKFAPKAGFFAGMMGHKVEVTSAELEQRLKSFDAVKIA